jgi:hypothetical protein
MPKYKVYVDYRFTVEIGEFETETEEQAIELASSKASNQHILCYQCEQDMLDHPILDDDSFTAEKVREV